MIKKLKEKILYLGLEPKKEFIIILIVNLSLIGLSLASLFILKSFIYLAGGLGIAFIFNLVFLSRYSKQISYRKTEELREFATLFGYFRIYIHNGYSVYSSLKELVNFASENLKKYLEELLSEIDEDKSVQPFIKFGKRFDEIIVEEMMISIYQLIDDGETSDYLTQFELIFDKFSDLLYQNYLRAKDKRLGTIAASSLIGSAFLMIILTIGIIGIIGELINGV